MVSYYNRQRRLVIYRHIRRAPSLNCHGEDKLSQGSEACCHEVLTKKDGSNGRGNTKGSTKRIYQTTSVTSRSKAEAANSLSCHCMP